MNKYLKPRKQSGFTLVEMMVSIGISSFLLLVVIVMFSSTSRSRMLQTSLSELNESGRFALSVLSRDLRMAGYRDSNWLNGSIPDPIVAVNGDPVDGGDSITIQYEALKDCNYVDTAAGLATNVYALNMDTLALECNDQPLVDGIEQMQIYFGEDITGDGVANRMMAPNDPVLNMSRVVSVRLNILVRSDADQQAFGAQEYFFDDVKVEAEDKRLRRQYSVTVALRNPI